MRYLLGVIGAIFFIVLAIILIVRHNPGPATPGTEVQGAKVVSLYDDAKDGGTVAYTIQGEVVGEQEYHAIRITASSNIRTAEVLRGYNEAVEKSESFTNSQAGFETFLKSLELAGFSRQRNFSPTDERGICPLGNRYVFQLRENGEQTMRTWATSCSTKQGTSGAATATVRRLFENQIPEYDKFKSGVVL